MKLHLPRALRGALLAAFALCCTTPAWADWTTNSYHITADNVAAGGAGTLTISTADGAPDANGWFMRTFQGNANDFSMEEEAPNLTVNEFILVKPASPAANAAFTLNIEGHWNTAINPGIGMSLKQACAFTGLTFETLNVGSEFSPTAKATIRIAEYNTLTVNSITGSGTVAFNIESGATLNLDFTAFAGTLQVDAEGNPIYKDDSYDRPTRTYSGGVAANISGAGTLVLHGDIDWDMVDPRIYGGILWSEESYSPNLNLSAFTGTIDISNLNITLPDGHSGGVDNNFNNKVFTVTALPLGVQRKDDAGVVTWTLSADTSVEGLEGGDWPKPDGVPMEETDTICFAGGALRSGSADNPVVTVYNPITALVDNPDTDWDDACSIILSPADGSTLIIDRGEDALGAEAGLVIRGDAGGTVKLDNLKADSVVANVTVHEQNTLVLISDDALSVNGADNSFDAHSSLFKEGSGAFTYIAGADEKIDQLGHSEEGGELIVKNTLHARNVSADTITLAEGSDILSVTGILSAKTINLGKEDAMSMAGFHAGTLLVTSALNMGSGTAAEAVNATINALNVTAASAYSVYGDSGRVQVTGITSIADATDDLVGGNVSSENIRLNAYMGEAAIGFLRLENEKLTTSTIENTQVHIGLAEDGIAPLGLSTPTSSTTPEITLELGEVTNSLVSGNQDTLIQNSSFKGSSSIAFTNGSLRVVNSDFEGTTSISHTAENASITLTNICIAPSGTIKAGESTYTIGQNAPAFTFSGTATAEQLKLSSLNLDFSNSKTEVTDVTLFESDGTNVVNDAGCTFNFITAPGFVGTIGVDAYNNLVYSVADVRSDIYDEVATTPNADTVKPILMDNLDSEGELGELIRYVIDSSRVDEASRKAALEALTSGSITMLADSQRRGVVNNINALRNRVIQMGHAQGIETETTWHAWIEADGSYNDISGDDAAGYEFNTWGGTVGAHADVGNFSFGAAISAAYGELTADSADNASGNNDTITASAFARHQRGNWVQMGILSVGMNELEMERTVSDYKATGDTNGMTVTAYYEAGYTCALGESGSQVIQPLVSLMLTSAQMDAFSESGSIGSAGLITEDEEYFYGTLGIGARYQAVLSEDIYERISFIELRAKIVQDFGDDTHEASVRFAGAPGSPFVLQGTEVGSFGFQFGAGISVPLGLQTTFFADVDADIRDNATSVSGAMGVRVQF